jgi:A/G-specific adenine glycosylase
VIRDRFRGRLPCDPAELSALPGIGRYTRGAILSIAFNRSEPIVDANVARVLSRVFAIDGDPKSARNQEKLWNLAEELIPSGQARDFNQSLMELGALVCSPFDPDCERCPLLAHCKAGNSPDPTAWPQIPPGKRTVRVTHASALISREDKVLLVRRPPHGLWGGLWEMPRRVCLPGESPSACAERAALEIAGIEGRAADSVGIVKHSVTHHAIALHGIRVIETDAVAKTIEREDFRWMDSGHGCSLPLSAPQKRLLELLADKGERPK